MRKILFSAINSLVPGLALLFPIGSVLFQIRAVIPLTTAEVAAFLASAFLAGVVSVAFFTVRCNNNPFQEACDD